MKTLMMILLLLTVMPAFAEQTTWNNVPVLDGMCLNKMKATPDNHTVKCLLQCNDGGYGILTEDGTYLRFDDAGNQRLTALLKETSKKDHVRVNVTGERKGDTITVKEITLPS